MEDYKIRLIKEYCELKVRYDKLHKFMTKWKAGTLEIQPVCSYELMQKQENIMAEYLEVLEIRAEIEGIGIEGLEKARDPEAVELKNSNSEE